MSRRKVKCSAKNVRKTSYLLTGGPFDGKLLFLTGAGTVTFGVGKFYGRYETADGNFGNKLKWKQM